METEKPEVTSGSHSVTAESGELLGALDTALIAMEWQRDLLTREHPVTGALGISELKAGHAVLSRLRENIISARIADFKQTVRKWGLGAAAPASKPGVG